MPDSKYTKQTVLSVHEWVANKLLSVTTTRDPAFNFQPGQFARLGLPATQEAGAPPTIWRAYSMVNSPDQNDLEFYSVVVPDGEFSPKFATLQPGDPLYIDKQSYGFLTLDRFEPGGDLWLLATGTGLSAYLSMLHDRNTWQSFDRIILVHGVRYVQELTYHTHIQAWQANGLERLISEQEGVAGGSRRAKFVYLPLPTRESLRNTPQGRLNVLLETGELENHAKIALDPAHSKVMLCGNPAMLTQTRQILTARGFAVGRRGQRGNLAVENYW